MYYNAKYGMFSFTNTSRMRYHNDAQYIPEVSYLKRQKQFNVYDKKSSVVFLVFLSINTCG